MNEKYYTSDGLHPDDAIYKAKVFINELQKVQEQYFTKLAQELKITKEGEDWLFDFVFNSSDEDNYDGFEHYLSAFGKEYDDIVSRDIMFNNSVDNLLSTDFGEFSPMIHMSSYEPDLETAFPSSYEDINLPVSSLDTIMIQSSGTEVGYY